jgi:predicted  nucleic acid-binding Zn-ribbon protein
MNEELKKSVEAAVAEIFSQKEEAEQRAETEKALQKSADTITQLTEALEGKNAEAEEVASQITELETKIEELTSKLEAAEKKAEETATKLAESENLIEEMKRDKAAELRMAELADAGVALSNKDAQTAKVRGMEDEEFASYKEELVSLRSAVEAELAKAVSEETASEEETQEEEVAEETAEAEEETEEEVASDEEEDASEEEEETLPANVDRNTAVAAALNMEARPSDNILAKYAKLGEAMAQRMKKE